MKNGRDLHGAKHTRYDFADILSLNRGVMPLLFSTLVSISAFVPVYLPIQGFYPHIPEIYENGFGMALFCIKRLAIYTE